MGNIRPPKIRRWLILFSLVAAVSATAADRDYPFLAANYEFGRSVANSYRHIFGV
jgi:hypothetical protein